MDGLTPAQVTRFHSAMADKPAAANFALSVIGKFIAWAEDTGRRPAGNNPCRGIKKFRTRKMERIHAWQNWHDEKRCRSYRDSDTRDWRARRDRCRHEPERIPRNDG